MSEDKKYIEEIDKEMRVDADKLGVKQRFGYFSIPYSAYSGDRFYSQGKKTYRNEDRKVITEVRGVFTNPGKKGKNKDAFFSNAFQEEKGTLKMLEEMAKKEQEDLLTLVHSRKKGAAVAEGFRVAFKPGGPQEYKDFYDKDGNRVEYKEPITYQPDKKLKIDKEHRSVFMEKRGIYCNPPKHGTSSTHGILFSTFKDERSRGELKEESKKSRAPKASVEKDNKNYKIPFKPAAVQKNEPFQSDGQLYGENDKEFKKLLEEALDVNYNNCKVI
jgi:hypothetical protein